MIEKHLYIFGGKSTALEIYETANSLNIFSNIYYVISDIEDMEGQNILRESDLKISLNDKFDSYFIASMSDVKIKNKCVDFAEKLGLSKVSIVHPTAFVSSTAKVGLGVYVAANSVISSNAIIDDHCIVNYSAVIGHDVRIGECCTINPGAVIGGNTTVGKNVMIGANSFVVQGLFISKNSKIDAMTHVYYSLNKASICTSRNIKVVEL